MENEVRKTRAENEVDCGARGLIWVLMLFWSFLWPPPKMSRGKERPLKGGGKAAKRPDVQRRPRRKPQTSAERKTIALAEKNVRKMSLGKRQNGRVTISKVR